MALGTGLAFGVWSVCPRAIIRHPMLEAAAAIDAIADISPLSGWPDTYSAGVVDCLLALRQERARAAEEAARER